MINYSVPFSRIDLEQDFWKLSKALDGQVNNNDNIVLVGMIGKGEVRKLQLEPGLYMRTWNVTLNQATDICKEGIVDNNDEDTWYHVIYILSPDAVSLKRVGQHQQYNKMRVKSTLLTSSRISIDLQVEAHSQVQLIDFSISAEWLRGHIGDRPSPVANQAQSQPVKLPAILIDPCSSQINQAAIKLFDLSLQSNMDAEMLQTLSSLLVTDFLRKSFYGEARNTRSNKEFYHKKIMEAEAILQAHLQKNLPRLENIAQQVALSESTLKRYFKVIFGKSVYEYYLEKKMDFAKTLLLGQPITVNEAAEILGYEKVSNFIDIFKKHHGYSPGSMKKRLYANINVANAGSNSVHFS